MRGYEMIHHSITQGSIQWHDIRSVMPTASNFERLITPAKWEPTKGETRRNYQLELLANRIFGIAPDDLFSSAAMAHGREWEPIARAAYEFERDVEIQEGGFFTDDAETYGASPDGLIGEDGLIEFKNPESPKVHLAALIDNLGYERESAISPLWTAQITEGSSVTGFLRDHWAQVQGQLFVSGRAWVDLVCNFARLPMVVVRVYPNPTYLKLLKECLFLFCNDLRGLTEVFKDRGWYRPKKRVVVQDGIESLGLTEADLEAIIASRKAKEPIGAAK